MKPCPCLKFHESLIFFTKKILRKLFTNPDFNGLIDSRQTKLLITLKIYWEEIWTKPNQRAENQLFFIQKYIVFYEKKVIMLLSETGADDWKTNVGMTSS